jgi:hypothetical protein
MLGKDGLIEETWHTSLTGPYTVERTYIDFVTTGSALAFTLPQNARVPVRTGYTGANAVRPDAARCKYCKTWVSREFTHLSCRNCGANDYE